MEQKTTIAPKISVIIPVFNEMLTINHTIQSIRKQAKVVPIEIIIADGGPGHKTLNSITDPTVTKAISHPGRGIQMNTGASIASAEVLLFLHADTRLPDDFAQSILSAVQTVSAGAFSLSIDSDKTAYAIIAWFANLRSRIERIPYGDQAQFIKTTQFHHLGGFAPIPIMEDVELFRRIRTEGLPISILPGKVTTSPRRWEKEGLLRRTVTNWWLRVRYRLGVSPQILAGHYRPHKSEAD
jgi:rSAM/selenodomain-associated transferase 2